MIAAPGFWDEWRWSSSAAGTSIRAVCGTGSNIDALSPHRHRFHSDWNYTIHPKPHDTARAAKNARSAGTPFPAASSRVSATTRSWPT